MFDSMLLLMEAWLPPNDAHQKRMGRFQWQVKDPIPFVKMQPLFIGLHYYPVSLFSHMLRQWSFPTLGVNRAPNSVHSSVKLQIKSSQEEGLTGIQSRRVGPFHYDVNKHS